MELIEEVLFRSRDLYVRNASKADKLCRLESTHHCEQVNLLLDPCAVSIGPIVKGFKALLEPHNHLVEVRSRLGDVSQHESLRVRSYRAVAALILS